LHNVIAGGKYSSRVKRLPRERTWASLLS